MTSLFGWFLIVVAALAFVALRRWEHSDPVDDVWWTVGMGGVLLASVAGPLVVITTADMEGNLPQVATFAAVVAALGAVAVGILWYIRSRPRTFDTEPVTGQSQRNFVPGKKVYAWGEYSPEDIRAARANASRIRKGVRA